MPRRPEKELSRYDFDTLRPGCSLCVEILRAGVDAAGQPSVAIYGDVVKIDSTSVTLCLWGSTEIRQVARDEIRSFGIVNCSYAYRRQVCDEMRRNGFVQRTPQRQNDELEP